MIAFTAVTSLITGSPLSTFAPSVALTYASVLALLLITSKMSMYSKHTCMKYDLILLHAEVTDGKYVYVLLRH